MVALEAWALGRPVLANGKCDVLKGQCIRSNAGLYYETLRGVRRNAAGDRAEPLAERRRSAATAASSSASTTTGRSSSGSTSTCSSGCRRNRRRRAIEPLPGWFDRRRQDLPAAEDVLAKLPTGPRRRRHASSPTAGGGRDPDPPGARDARLRRRDRPRGARHPARAARGRLRVGDLRRDRRSRGSSR